MLKVTCEEIRNGLAGAVGQLYGSVRRETVTSHHNWQESMIGAETVQLSVG